MNFRLYHVLLFLKLESLTEGQWKAYQFLASWPRRREDECPPQVMLFHKYSNRGIKNARPRAVTGEAVFLSNAGVDAQVQLVMKYEITCLQKASG